MANLICLITGGNAGIGRAAAVQQVMRLTAWYIPGLTVNSAMD